MNNQDDYSKNGISFVGDGTFHGAAARARLVREGDNSVARRGAILALSTWIMLLVICLFEGSAISGKIPYLRDFNAYIRFLIALPLLFAAEPIVDKRLKSVSQFFSQANLIKQESMQDYASIIDRVICWRDSKNAHAIIGGLAILSGVAGLLRSYGSSAETWQFARHDNHLVPSVAGVVYWLLANPLVFYVVYSWLWRYVVWAMYLHCVAGLNLNLIATHPDKAAGLGFLEIPQSAFALITLPFALVEAGMAANKIVFLKMPLAQLESFFIVIVVISIMIILAPLLAFTPKLLRTYRTGVYDYSKLSGEYMLDFDKKWNRAKSHREEPILGTNDIQSLADIGNSFAVVAKMRIVPFTTKLLIIAAASAVVPFAALLIAITPPEGIAHKISGLLVRLIGF